MNPRTLAATLPIALLAGHAAASCPPFVIRGHLNSANNNGLGAAWPSVAGVQTGRLTRDGADGTCLAPKVGNLENVNPVPFRRYTFTNTSASARCVVITMQPGGGGEQLQAFAYVGPHSPANPLLNHVSDAGYSNAGGALSFSALVPAGQNIDVVVINIDNTTADTEYTLGIQGLECQDTPEPIVIEGTMGVPQAPGTRPRASTRIAAAIPAGVWASTCWFRGPCPAFVEANTPVRASVHPIVNNSGAPRCYTATLTTPCATGLRLAGFAPGFSSATNLAGFCELFRGSSGSLASGNTPRSFSFVLQPNDYANVAAVDSGGVSFCGAYTLVLESQSVPVCYANCDGSTSVPALNALDFGCFLNRYRAGHPYANCDGSTTQPVLNALDFSCFLQRYSAGCN